MENTIGFICAITLVFFIVVGLLGNVTSLLVWTWGKRCQSVPVKSYFRFLSICDVLILTCPAVGKVIELWDKDILNRSNLICKGLGFSVWAFAQVSASMLVALTIERTVSMCFPMRSRSFSAFANKRSKFIFVVIVSVVLALNIVTLFAFSVENITITNDDGGNLTHSFNATNLTFCVVKESLIFVFELKYFADVTLTVIIPIVTILTCNLTILVILYRQNNQWAADKYRERQFRRLSILVVIYGFTYIVTMMPLTFALSCHLKFLDCRGGFFHVFYPIASCLTYINNALNCYMYCFLSDDFRKDLLEIIRRSYSKRHCTSTYIS